MNDDTASRIVITRITDPVITDLNTNLREISWPALQNHLLRPHESVDGLYLSPNGDLYAHLEEGGYYRAEINATGDYQIPWPAAPGVTPPLLKKIDGQPRWRVEADWYSRIPQPGNQPQPAVTAAPPPASVILPAHLATLLTSAQSTVDGVRYDKHKKSYVDMAEGTVMVRKNTDGHYQETFAGELTPSGAVVEQITGTKLWRRKAEDNVRPDNRRPAIDEPTAGPSKRPRLDTDPDSIDPPLAVLPTGDWITWGNATKPQTGDSIEIDGKHYPIVTQAAYADNALVFIKHPHLSAERFDAFEQILRMTPELQPRGAVKIKRWWLADKELKWEIVDGLPFKKTITQYVADAFPYMAEHSVNNVARAMFNRANHSEEMNGYGLNDLFATVQYWAKRPMNMENQKTIRHDLIDPLMFLPPVPKNTGNSIQCH
ncbi:hypothetical protein IAI51_20275 [Pseudomonas sp. N40(2020)]|uniref:hypothetical protein n=1 Tax=Pseudomonas sp. N40(2020) TaxID=2767798 RepID=UPI001656DF3E|nr:hypothetical protein [Pseudomonas sp. N40(2020)]MBC8998868.1 hypothetical protein [Pseudomonas sp. N40(2020)]